MNMKRSFAILLAALALAACNEKPEEPAVPQQVRITPVITRATDVNFEDGDAIGLTITRAAGAYATNEKLTYSGNSSCDLHRPDRPEPGHHLLRLHVRDQE